MSSNSHRGFTLIELMIVVAIIGTLAALMVPFLIGAKKSANESSAIGSLRAINTAEANYASTCANGAYAVNIPLLVSANYLSPDMGFNPKSGYDFAVSVGATSLAGPADCRGEPTVTEYYAIGRPISGMAGTRAFATSERATIWQDETGVPPTQPFTRSANVSPLQ